MKHTPMKRSTWARRPAPSEKELNREQRIAQWTRRAIDSVAEKSAEKKQGNRRSAHAVCAPVAIKKVAKFTRRGVIASVNDAVFAQPKEDVARSEKYRRLVAVCSVDDCGSKTIAKGLCNKHYLRLKNHGAVELPALVPRTAREALDAGSLAAASGCIEWQKCLREGYGRVFFEGRLHSAHVLSWERVNGPIPEDKQINHTCHNRSCINVDHLYLGDQVQNMADMREAGRARPVRGTAVATAKLDEVNVLAIRASSKSGAQLAREYEVSESLIRSIRQRQSWAWLEDPAVSFPKQNVVRSEEYRRLVAHLVCAHCGIVGYSQAAHPPPTAKGMKEDDRMCFPLCCARPGVNGCHYLYDQNKLMPREAMRIQAGIWADQVRTVISGMGMWPKGLPLWKEVNVSST